MVMKKTLDVLIKEKFILIKIKLFKGTDHIFKKKDGILLDMF